MTIDHLKQATEHAAEELWFRAARRVIDDQEYRVMMTFAHTLGKIVGGVELTSDHIDQLSVWAHRHVATFYGHESRNDRRAYDSICR